MSTSQLPIQLTTQSPIPVQYIQTARPLNVIYQQQQPTRVIEKIVEVKENTTVFQSQIQSLNLEIDRLNAVLHDKCEEAEAFKAKCAHLESHMSSFNLFEQRIYEYESRIEIITTENVTITKNLMQKIQEIDILRNDLNSTHQQREHNERLKNSALQDKSNLSYDLQKLNELLKKKESENHTLTQRLAQFETLQMEYKSLQVQFNNRGNELSDAQKYIQSLQQEVQKKQTLEKNIVVLSVEVERLHKILRERLDEVEYQRSRAQQLEVRLQELVVENNKIPELENKVLLLTNEIERLNQVLKIKIEDSEKYKSRIINLEQALFEAEQMKNEIRRLAEFLELRDKEIYELRQKLNQYELIITELKIVEGRNAEYENKLTLFSAEIERLNKSLRDKSEELENQRLRIHKLEMVINELRSVDEDARRLQELLNLRINENNQLKSKLRDQENQLRELVILKEQLNEYENRIALLSGEIERLNGVIRTKQQESDNLKQTNKQLEGENLDLQYQIKEYNQLKELHRQKLRDLEDWKLKFSKSETTIQEYRLVQIQYEEITKHCQLQETEITNLKRSVNQRYEEIDSLKIQITQLQQYIVELRSYEEKLRILSEEIDRLNQVNKELLSDCNVWKNRYYDEHQLAMKIQDYQVMFVLMSSEIEGLRIRISEKSLQVEQARKQSIAIHRQPPAQTVTQVVYRQSQVQSNQQMIDQIKMESQKFDNNSRGGSFNKDASLAKSREF